MPKNTPKKQNTITVMDYDQAHLEEKKTARLEDCVPYRHKPTVTWINIDQVPPADFLHELGLGFDLHPVVLSDIRTPNQRPKLEIMEDYVYLVLRMMSLNKDKKIVPEQVSLIIANKFLISTQEGIQGDVFDSVRKAIRNVKSTTRRSGTDYLGYKLLDAIVNAYFGVLEVYGETTDKLEDQMLKNPTTKTLHNLHSLKQSILDMRKAVWPLRDVVGSLERGDSPLIKKTTRIYLRDVYQRLTQVIDTIEIQRETLTGLLDVYLSSTSNKMNSVMKMLTIITTVFMPLSFLAGVYGMNFRYMPGMESLFGFPIMAGLMLLVFLSMMIYFRLKKWL